jgi:DNA-binding transcriptional LysR family regulator
VDRWSEMALFVQVAETGSLSRAAEVLGLSNAAASRHLSALEERLGARLVERNTRRLYLTEPGQEFLRRSKVILAELSDAESAVNASTLNPTGMLRVTASLSFSMQHIAPLLPEYTRRYPNVTVHVETANRYLDLIDNNIDVAAQDKVLRIAMTAADIPRTLGQPDQGFEGNRFTGIPMYDALTHWDLSRPTRPACSFPAWPPRGRSTRRTRPSGSSSCARASSSTTARLQRRRRGLERAQGARQGRRTSIPARSASRPRACPRSSRRARSTT